jgi:hypothetical protein
VGQREAVAAQGLLLGDLGTIAQPGVRGTGLGQQFAQSRECGFLAGALLVDGFVP